MGRGLLVAQRLQKRDRPRGKRVIQTAGFLLASELAMDFPREEEIRLAKDEYNRFISSYDYDSFVVNCKARSRLLIEDQRDGARFIADEAIRALGCSKALLMVRIGDAEGNLLQFALHPNAFDLKWVNAVFLINDNQPLPIEDAKRLSRELSELLAGADIIGLRAFGPNPWHVQIRKIAQAIDRNNLRGALGMVEALQYGDRAVKNGEFRNIVLTSAWVHLGLLEHLDVLLDNAPRVVVITGRHELETLFSEKLKNRLRRFSRYRCKRAINRRRNGHSIIQLDTMRSSRRCGQTFAERSCLAAPAF